MTAQLSLSLSNRATRKRVGPQLARRMMAILAARGTWVKRKQFASYGLTDRQCRLGRECSHGRIIVGQQGFRLMREATAAEIREHTGFLESSIKALQSQLAQAYRRSHKQLASKREE